MKRMVLEEDFKQFASSCSLEIVILQKIGEDFFERCYQQPFLFITGGMIILCSSSEMIDLY